MNWYCDAWKKYTQFSGRASREAFWMFMLFNILISGGLIFLEIMLQVENILEGIYSLLVLIPTCALITRRLHDINRSGWWGWIIVIPAFGMLILIYFLAMPSDKQDNQFNTVIEGGAL